MSPWDDRQIRAGEDWAQQIEQAAAQARIAILLISDDFLASKFIMQQEVPYFLQRRQQGDLIVFPIIVTDCFWDIIDWLKVIQVRPKDGKPLAEFEEAQRDKVIKEMVREIYSLLATPI
ncbi:MAG: TIR domain-containing protein [Thioploca sp.]|nr:TIR domain-containing protein [Thioploca sp.]